MQVERPLFLIAGLLDGMGWDLSKKEG